MNKFRNKKKKNRIIMVDFISEINAILLKQEHKKHEFTHPGQQF